MKKVTVLIAGVFIVFALVSVVFCVFIDQAVLTRKGTIYKVPNNEKAIAITFDDGPSPVWTPEILDVLKEHNVKATFFMVGKHLERYPQVGKRVAEEGHEIGNHTYLHHVLLYYTNDELHLELKYTEYLIESITGKKATLFRPPKAWLTGREKEYIKDEGYKIVLWSINSKDWVSFFNVKYIVNNLLKRIKPGDIILFHDAGGTFTVEGGARSNTVKAVRLLIEKCKARGYKFMTVSELIEAGEEKQEQNIH